MNNISSEEATCILQKTSKLSNLSIEEDFWPSSICKRSLGPKIVKKDLLFENCNFNNFFSTSDEFKGKLTIQNCKFKGRFEFVGSFFLQPIKIQNCDFYDLVNFSCSGYFSLFILEENTFAEMVKFTDSNFTHFTSIRNNDFKKGTNILGGETIKATFENEPIFINNKGPLDLKID